MEIEIIAALFSDFPNSKFVIVIVGLILGKIWVDRVTGQLWEIHIRYELDM